MLFSLPGLDEDGYVCIDGSVTIKAEIVTKDRDAALTGSHFFIFDSNWPLSVDAIGSMPFRETDFVGTTTWEDTEDTSKEITVGPTCLHSDDGLISVSVGSTTNELQQVNLSISFTNCLAEHDCNCCCEHCCGDCHFPVTKTLCDDNDGVIPGGGEEGGPSQIVSFITTVTASSDVFCDNTTNELTIEQSGLSFHLATCHLKCPDDASQGWCSKSGCTFGVPILQDCPDAEPFVVGVSYSGPVGGPYEWGVSSGGVGYVYWVVGRTSYTGDCDGATASGTFTNLGVTFTWTTTFTVTRTMPDDAPTCPLGEES